MQAEGAVHLVAAPGSVVTVNSAVVAAAPLSEGDVLGVGSHRFRFHARGATPVNVEAPVEPWAAATAGPPTVLPQTRQLPTMLQAVSGPHAGECFPLVDNPMVIGRDPGCHVPLPRDSMASRQHATLVWDGAEWTVHDNGSTNGLSVNAERTARQPVWAGDEIGVGQSMLRLT